VTADNFGRATAIYSIDTQLFHQVSILCPSRRSKRVRNATSSEFPPHVQQIVRRNQLTAVFGEVIYRGGADLFPAFTI
jgi:hypothetical protein